MAHRFGAVIFDFGGVLTLPQDAASVTEMARLCRLSAEAFTAEYGRKRLDLDRGSVSPAGYWGRILSVSGAPAVAPLVERLTDLDRGSWLRINTRTLDWSRELRRAGYRTAILSNMPPGILVSMRASLPWLSEFDPAVFSCDVGLVKPESEFYTLCLDRLGMAAPECVFLDDNGVNVRAGEAAGIASFLFRSEGDAARELAALDPFLPVARLSA